MCGLRLLLSGCSADTKAAQQGAFFIQLPQFLARLKGGGENIHVTVVHKKDSTETRIFAHHERECVVLVRRYTA